ncbi:hypothetical protein Tco_0483559 [Tanacetum coccineum]
MVDHSQKWHNGTSTRTRSTDTFDGLAAIQAQLNSLGREIKKVNERVYAAQVGCESCGGPHYTKDCPLKEEGKTFEEAYHTQFGVPFPQGGRYRAAYLGFYQRDNGNSSHDENSNLIKEIRSSTDAAIRNQGALIKALEIQIGQISKVLQERGSGSLPRLGKLTPTKLLIELADRKIKRLKGIAENVLIGLRERMELDLEVRLMGEALVLNRSLNPTYGDYTKLNALNEPLELKRN